MPLQYDKQSSLDAQSIPLEKFLSTSKTGFLILDGNLTCKFHNDVVLQMFGIIGQNASSDDILQKLVLNEKSFHPILRCIINNGVWNRQYDQQGNILNISIFCLRENPELLPLDDLEFLVEIRDCTQELKDLKSIDAQFTLDKEKEKLSAEFFNQITHQFKTPLHAILGFSEHIKAADNLPDEHAGHIDEIINASRSLLGSVNEMIDSSRTREFRLNTQQEHMILDDLFQECAALYSVVAAKRDITINADGKGIRVFSDKIRLKQVLMNILNNAIKYNLQGGRVIIRAQEFKGEYLILVLDTGRGIVQSDQINLLSPFRRFTTTGFKQSKTGMSLMITKKLLEVLDSRLNIVSQKDMGSLFWMRLPINKPQIVKPENPVLDIPRRLLWLDNDRDSQGLCRSLNNFFSARHCLYSNHQNANQALLLDNIPALIVVKQDIHGNIPIHLGELLADVSEFNKSGKLLTENTILTLDKFGKIDHITGHVPGNILDQTGQFLTIEMVLKLMEGIY